MSSSRLDRQQLVTTLIMTVNKEKIVFCWVRYDCWHQLRWTEIDGEFMTTMRGDAVGCTQDANFFKMGFHNIIESF